MPSTPNNISILMSTNNYILIKFNELSLHNNLTMLVGVSLILNYF